MMTAPLVVLECPKCNRVLRVVEQLTTPPEETLIMIPVCPHCSRRSQASLDRWMERQRAAGRPDALPVLPGYSVPWPATEVQPWIDRALSTGKTQHLIIRFVWTDSRYALTAVDQPDGLEP